MPLVENGHFNTPVTRLVIEEYLTDIRNAEVDTLIMGCTHYPLAKKEIKNVLGDVEFFDGANGVSRQLKRVLDEKDLLSDSKEKGTVTFIDSSLDEKVREEKKNRFFKIISEEHI